MTCIVGYVEQNVSWIVGDSAACDATDNTMRVRQDPKVFRNGSMIIGYSGSFRVGQVMRYELKLPSRPNGMEPFEYMVTRFVSTLKKCVEKHGISKEMEETQALVGYAGQLFCIESDLQVAMNNNHFEAIGMGRLLAIGSMHTTSKLKIETQKRLLLAITSASEFSHTVSPPFLLGWLKSPRSYGFLISKDGKKWTDYVSPWPIIQ